MINSIKFVAFALAFGLTLAVGCSSKTKAEENIPKPDTTQPVGQIETITGFVAVNDAALSRDLANGSGEYVDAVWQITATPADARGEALKTLRSLRLAHPSPPDFAEAAGRALVKD